MSYSRKLDGADMTWTSVGENTTWTFVALYGKVEYRDWRWLWLRKRRRTVLLGYESV